MSRSRRKMKLPKCICGRHLVRPVDHVTPRDWRGCTVLEMLDDHNEKFLKFRERRSHPLKVED